MEEYEFELTPELILPSQMFQKTLNTSGECNLLRAILIDAINCYISKNNKKSLIAEAWFRSSNIDPITSYRSICSHLSLNADKLWNGIIKHRRNAIIKKRNGMLYLTRKGKNPVISSTINE